jgi:hypothetical protein
VQAPLSTLAEGAEVSGRVIGLHYLHGAVIDLGCDYHGLVPVFTDQWAAPAIREGLTLGIELTFVVHKVQPSPSLGRDVSVTVHTVQLSACPPAWFAAG